MDWPSMLLSTHSVDILVSNAWYTLGLELGRYGRFWPFGSTWFRPTSATFLVRIPHERNLQILDTNHSGVARQLRQQIQHIAPGTALRKRPSLATRRSTIAFLFANSSVPQSLISRSVPRFKPLFIESVNPF
ncbi:unnamed protein product [Schistosoma mattheei]|uniref:Uncharacterized protein n=1 Tax=Schistosoma mattheei TaxID=31246 RepID=A0A3P7YQ65_9TREM|nr:unnamed protein product [Schistosoma mattheei]